MRFLLVILLALLPATLAGREELSGDIIYVHDPSTLVKDGGRYYCFTTSNGLEYRWSDNLREWTYGGKVFPTAPPSWATSAVPGYDGNLWAPDAAYFNGKYHIYYSISVWGTNDSAIGLVTTPSLTTPVWTDEGKVLQSDPPGATGPDTDLDYANCIDQSIFQDTDGRIWMVFGSYFEGIYVTELDPTTGKRLGASPITKIADSGGPGWWNSGSEAAYLYKHDGYYYLFFNVGQCCAWMNSTYQMRIGRSTSVTGPYLDRDGVDLLDGGGTVFMESSGRFIGPGHAGILPEGNTEWFTHHYYDGNFGGEPHLGLTRVSWDAEGWPSVEQDWSAFYPFNVDASEHMDLYDGTLMGGASIVSDPALGQVLELDGIDGYVELPPAVANARTFSAWVKWNGGNPWQRIFDFGAEVGTSAHWFLCPMDGDGKIRCGIFDNGAYSQMTAPYPLPVGSWCHVAVTLDGPAGVLYLNGEAVATHNSVDVRPWQILPRNNYLGRSQFVADDYFDGCLDSVRLFARALSPGEIWEIATAHPSLAHRYRFNAEAKDTIGMAHGRLHGDASVTGGALHLTSATSDYARLPGGLVSGSGALTIEFWADLGSNGAWARVFDFGTFAGATGSDFLFFSPGNAAGDLHFDHSGTILTTPGSGLNNQSVHIACILDPAAGYAAVFQDGKLVHEQVTSWPALGDVSRAWSWLGRSLFSADPFLNGSIHEFRIYDARLTPAEIALSHRAGPEVHLPEATLTITRTPTGFDLTWPSYPLARLRQKKVLTPGIDWLPVPTPLPAGGTNTHSIPLPAPGTPGRQFFQLVR